MKMTMKEWLVPVLAVAAVCWGTTLAAQDKEAAKAALSARVSLERGLSVSASHGRPISAKFEMEDGRQITTLGLYGDDWKILRGGRRPQQRCGHQDRADWRRRRLHRQSQSAAMAKAKVSLRAAVQRALRGNAGFRAVSVTPSLKDGRAVAEVALAKGEELKTVSVPL